MDRGTVIGEWVVEEPDLGGWRCHHLDSPFRRAVARRVSGPGAAATADAWSRVSHPRLSPVVAVERSGEDWFVLAEVVAGTPLDRFLAERSAPLGVRAALDVALQVCDALRTLHDLGLSHGDVGPSTVLLGTDGRVRLSAPSLDVPDPTADRRALGALLALLVAGAPDAVPTDPELAALVAACQVADPSARPAVDAIARRLQARREALSARDSGRNTTTGPTSAAAGPAAAPTRIGRYTVIRELGRGGAGVVYEANDPELRRRVALKVLLSGPFARSRELARFRQEAQAVARLSHDGIVQVLDIGSHGDAAWFAMEFVDGPTLMEAVRSRGGLPWRDAVRLVTMVARALHHAHEAGLLHRDVKPHNVLLDSVDPATARAKLADFGLALADDPASTRLTGTGQVLGTPVYMAPEQAMGDLRAQGPATDVYGLGVTLYEALTAKVPFEGATPLQLIGRILRGDPVSPAAHLPSLPRAVELVCLKSIRLDPADRYPTAAAFADDLERCLLGEPLSGVEPTRLERARWWVRGHQEALGRASLAIAAALGALAVVVALAVWWRGRADAQAEAVAATAWTSTQDRMRAAREAGDPAAADAAFQTFTGRPEHAGTRALTQAWWWRADERRGDARLSTLASAYAASAHVDDQLRALRRLALEARAERRYPLSKSVLETLRREGIEPVDDPELRAAWRDALFAERRLTEASTVRVGDGADSLIAALAGATVTTQRAVAAAPWPGGGLLLHDERHARVVAASPGLETVLDLEVPGVFDRFATPFAIDGVPYLAWRPTDEDVTVVARIDEEGRPVDAWTWPQKRYAAVVTDGPGGGPELYFAAGRSLHRLRRGPDGWLHDQPSPETDIANSEIGGLVAFRDGLALSSAEWSAFDVRILRHDHERLRLESRRRLGAMWGLTAGADTLFACKREGYPSARSLPADRPDGVEPGLWELAPDGAGSLTAALRSPGSCVNEPVVADLDGDGDLDVAIREHPSGIRFLARGADGTHTPLVLPELALVGAVELDGDPAAEVLVADATGQVVVLGAGSGALEPLAPVRPERAPVPEGADPVVTATWGRAEDLVYAGQLAEAAAVLQEVHDLRFGRPEGLAALRRAATLWEAHGDRAAADRAWRDADRAGAGEALERRAALHRRAGDDRQELAAVLELEARGELPPEWAEERRRLEGLRVRQATVLSFEQPLDPRWVIQDPLGLRREGSALRVEADGPGVLARLPVAGDASGWLGVEVDLAVERMEWGSFLSVQLESRSGGRFGVSHSARGGGWLLFRDVYCRGAETIAALRAGAGDESLSLATFRQPDGRSTCEARSATAAVGSKVVGLGGEGPWELVIRSEGPPGSALIASIDRIVLTGVAPTGEAPPPTASRSFVEGDLTISPDGDPRLAVALATARADRRALGRALDDAPPEVRGAAVAHLLHLRLGTAGPLLRERLGEEFPFAVANAWLTPLLTHDPADVTVATGLLPAIGGAERAAPADAEQRDLLATLLAWRGAAEVRRGNDDAAETSLRRALALQRDAAFGPVDDAGAASLVNAAHLELAAVRSRAGHLDEAFALLDDAVRQARSAELVRDDIASRPGLRLLWDDPRWADWRRPELPDALPPAPPRPR